MLFSMMFIFCHGAWISLSLFTLKTASVISLLKAKLELEGNKHFTYTCTYVVVFIIQLIRLHSSYELELASFCQSVAVKGIDN